MFTREQIEPLAWFINEREAIRIRKHILDHTGAGKERLKVTPAMGDAWGDPGMGLNKGWSFSHLTDDPILREYRFCNVQREHDRVTVWIRENIREPYADHPHLWFMLCIARYINWPPALKELIVSGAWPSSGDLFQLAHMTSILEARRARNEKCETGAYMIRAESDTKASWYNWSKQRYVSEVVLGKLWDERESWEDFLEGDHCNDEFWGLQRVWEKFQAPYYTGWGPFMAYQVCVDLRWTRYLKDAPDIQTWAAVGPGSRRGINRLLGRTVDAPLSQSQGLEAMLALRHALSQDGVLAPWVSLPDLSDIQNCLCETDKYLRVKNGEGRPRAKYVPGRGY